MKLLKALRVFCLIAEIIAGIGAIWDVCMVPASAWLIQARAAKARIYLGPQGCQLSLHARMGSTGEFVFNGSYLAQLDVPAGSLTVGPVAPPSDVPPRTAKSWKSPVDYTRTGTDLVITNPAETIRVFRALEAPLAIGSAIWYILWICVLHWFRRLFAAVERGEAFAPGTLKLVYRIGGLLIASTVAQVLVCGWVGAVIGSQLRSVVPHLSLAFTSQPSGGISGIAAGVIILALAEVFRQGSRLAEEARLTV